MNAFKLLTFPTLVRPWKRELSWTDQTGKARRREVGGTLRVTLALSSDLFPSPSDPSRLLRKRAIHVDFHGSEAGVGGEGLMFDREHKRGPYIDGLEYEAWVQPFGSTPDPSKRVPGLLLVEDQPQTDNASGSVSSSVSFNVSASGGAFGAAPMVQGGAGVALGRSYSHEVKDFTFYNRSDHARLHHVLHMTGCGDGAEYEGPRQLFDQWQSPLQGFGLRLRTLPSLAASDLPLVGQGVWMNDDERPLASAYDKVDVIVGIKPRYSWAQGRISGLEIKRHQVRWDELPTMYYGFELAFSGADVAPG